ncbi:pseudomurein-binding protein [Methanothermobacter marburgensis]|uniref:Predicted pseudomurein-binding protein n=1 Tax=Methanothermobacter marburgensis (strain ATCC BAA-927 / DSM 2133 / JCM 14651 / NBRC 100331 / OCM 82 / Marburg) TaxID=79929 RepID=D9PW04_METTM|nr:pseudomurein-binding repeat-containing protein [Methanothermobacter marburgensis]ADL58402.1 predicted pseudomurein-binding protein [Methanothermobacter marburgensis str. Marburg]WBF10545.1 pseudomurein-binding protein [Methanothermobacter marburgensis]
MRLVCMLTACMLLMNTAGYAVAADDTAFESEVECEKSLDQCSSLNESYSEDMVDSDSDGTLPSGADHLSADNTEPPVSVDREAYTPNTTDKPVVADADMANVSGNSGSHFQAAGDNSGVNHANTLSAAVDLKKYMETYGKLPSTVSVGSQKLTVAQFLDLMLKDLLKTAGKSASLTVRSVKAAPNPSGSATGQLSKSAYIKLAENVLKFINSNGRAPNYASSSIGRISFDNLIYAVSRILAFHADSGRLPNYVTVKKISATSTTPSSSLKSAAVDLKKYIETYGKLPSTVSVGSQKLTVAQFLDLMLKDLLKSAGKSASLTVRSVKAAPNPSGSATGQLSKSAYIELAENVLKFINSNGRAPNYVSSSIGRISFDNLIYAVSRILAFHADSGRLPNYVTVKKISATSTTPSSSLKKRPENDPYNGEGTSRYLSATANCQVNDTAIRSLAASLTSGLTSAWDKATAIFKWVRDSISYSFYYNTRYGATGTLKTRTGNCVDHSHLLVALFRAAGLPARYVHGTCTFTSGNTYGHVWAQVLVGDTWYAADATSSRNSLGAVSSWNTATAKIKGIYASLPF